MRFLIIGFILTISALPARAQANVAAAIGLHAAANLNAVMSQTAATEGIQNQIRTDARIAHDVRIAHPFRVAPKPNPARTLVRYVPVLSAAQTDNAPCDDSAARDPYIVIAVPAPYANAGAGQAVPSPYAATVPKSYMAPGGPAFAIGQ
jgi:hypothetical protein